MSVDGIWVFGDVCLLYQFKHVFNYEVWVVVYNFIYLDELVAADYCFVLVCVFIYLLLVDVGMME